jgi:hypothetical protein
MPNRVGAQDWAVDLPTQPRVDMAARAVDAALSRQRPFVYHGNSWGLTCLPLAESFLAP